MGSLGRHADPSSFQARTVAWAAKSPHFPARTGQQGGSGEQSERLCWGRPKPSWMWRMRPSGEAWSVPMTWVGSPPSWARLKALEPPRCLGSHRGWRSLAGALAEESIPVVAESSAGARFARAGHRPTRQDGHPRRPDPGPLRRRRWSATLHPRPPPDEKSQDCRHGRFRRRQIVEMLTAERNRREGSARAVRRGILSHIGGWSASKETTGILPDDPERALWRRRTTPQERPWGGTL